MKNAGILISKAIIKGKEIFLTISKGAENRNYHFSWPEFNNRFFESISFYFLGQEYIFVYWKDTKTVTLYVQNGEELKEKDFRKVDFD